jgi:uncharacterized damage-inducible protein DinB
MNKKYFTGLAAYNCWADQIVMGWLDQIDQQQWNQIITSSFSSIRQTAIHIASAEKIWIDFWTMAPDPVYLSAHFDGTKQDLMDIWKETSQGLQNFINNYPEENYLQPVTFRYPRGGTGQLEFWQTFSHIINHSTYHRGQLVTLLRQVGFINLRSIDLATYYITIQ